MAKAPDKRRKLEEGKSVLGAGDQKQVDRLLKKSAEKAAKDAKRKWKSAGRNPFSKHANAKMGGVEKALTNALTGALTFHSNNSGQRPSIRMTAPDTGGRPFHFDHTPVSSQTINLKPGETAKAGSTYGKREHAREKRHTSRTGAHMTYLERDGAAEMIEADLEAAAGIRAENEAIGRELGPSGMQEYLEDPAKEEALKAARENPPTALVFSYGTPDMGETLEERVAFWDLAEEHARGERGTIQHRLIMELPHEATPEDRLAIVKAFTAKFEEDGVPFHAVLHAPTSKNDDRNYHAHVVLLNRPAKKIMWPEGGKHYKEPDRPNVETWEFAAKAYGPDENKHVRWNYPERKKILDDYRATFVKDQRKRFSDIVNTRMAEVGNAVRYDPRSYRAMGIEVEAMRSISRIITDKTKANKRVVLDEGRTRRDIEAEVQRLARDRAPEFSEVSKVRAAVRAGDRELRTLEKKGAFLENKPILRRGAHAVKSFVKRKALDYARTRALHIERSIEASQEIRSVERVIEATKPEVIAKLRGRLAQSLIKARSSGNAKEVARLKKEMETVPKTAHAKLLNQVALKEVEILAARHERSSLVRMAKVRQALRDWRSAALGARPDLTPTATPTAVRTGGMAINAAPQKPVEIKRKPQDEHPMWRSYDDLVDTVFKTGFQKFMWNTTKRYGQFILDNADPNVPGRTPQDLADKLIAAVKQHPLKAEELILSYQDGREVPQPGTPHAQPPRSNIVYVDAPVWSAGDAAPIEPAFKQRARMPKPQPGEVKPYPLELTPLERVPAAPIQAPGENAPMRINPVRLPEHAIATEPPTDVDEDAPKRKEQDRRKKRQKAILAQRGRDRTWER